MTAATSGLAVITTENGGHRYEFDGQPVLGVSQILELAGLNTYANVDPAVLERVATLGKDVHLACEDLDRGGADWWSDDKEIGPRVEAYKRFKANYDFIVDTRFIERPMFHPQFRYAGTPDRLGTIRHAGPWARDGEKRFPVVLDLKRVWELRPSTDVQLAAYNLFFEDHETRQACALRLDNDGTYQFRAVANYKESVGDFIAALRIARWKLKHLKGAA